MQCEYGVENCIHTGKEHDEECCFNGLYTHTYICQECGYTRDCTNQTGKFPVKNCSKCKSEKCFV